MSFFASIRRATSRPHLAIDLGTANTRLYAEGGGLIADEPSLIMVRRDTGAVEAVGAGARYQMRNNARRRLVSPLRAGVITDVNAASELLRPLFRRASLAGLVRPRVLACVPSDAIADERAALVEAAHRAGVDQIVLAPEPLAAAIGSGMDVSSRHSQMIVDIGDGVTDIAVIRSGDLISTAAIRTAVSDMKRSVSGFAIAGFGVELHLQEAERVIREVGIQTNRTFSTQHAAAGDDCSTGVYRRIRLSSNDIALAMAPAVDSIVNFVVTTVRALPPEIACEVIESGIRLTGGGALLRGLADLIARETDISVRTAHDPLHAVIDGARQMLRVGIKTSIWENQPH